MKQQFHYATVTEAITQLKSQGFVVDFNLTENGLQADEETYNAGDFEIVDLYRYEGESDPGDEATVYALSSASGVRGTLVTGYGAVDDTSSNDILKDLHYKYQQSLQK